MAELGERMTCEEFGRWLVFMRVESIDAGAGIERWAQAQALAANGPLRKSDRTMFRAADFMSRRWTPPPPPRPATGASARAFVHALRAQTVTS